jgi:hypothetical protein
MANWLDDLVRDRGYVAVVGGGLLLVLLAYALYDWLSDKDRGR